jgi:hypothetical protein
VVIRVEDSQQQIHPLVLVQAVLVQAVQGQAEMQQIEMV